jgi:glycosyltransferase involved in cell wall biosynthesis
MVYWLQDLQGRAIEQLLTKKLGTLGRLAGRIASRYEQRLLRQSRRVITIAPGHDRYLPESVLNQDRFDLLENWCDPDDVPLVSRSTEWSRSQSLHNTLNVVYSGTLGLKHDLPVFIALAENCRNDRDVRIVIVSSGAAADLVREEAKLRGLNNLVVLPFQHFNEVPNVLGSAAVLIAPLDPSAGSFCVPSKILSYHCAGRPTVVSIDETNPVAHLIDRAKSGFVVRPGDTQEFVTAVRVLLANADLRQALGHNARQHAEANFKLQIIAARFLSILKKASVPVTHTPSAKEPEGSLRMVAVATSNMPLSE